MTSLRTDCTCMHAIYARTRRDYCDWGAPGLVALTTVTGVLQDWLHWLCLVFGGQAVCYYPLHKARLPKQRHTSYSTLTSQGGKEDVTERYWCHREVLTSRRFTDVTEIYWRHGELRMSRVGQKKNPIKIRTRKFKTERRKSSSNSIFSHESTPFLLLCLKCYIPFYNFA